MKLYATLQNTRGGKKGSGDDTRLIIELSYGNKVVGRVGLYSIIDDKTEGYRIVFSDPEKGFSLDGVLKEVENKKGKEQKDNKCVICRHKQDEDGRCLCTNKDAY